jgi:flagellar biosynthesis protein FlhG
MHDQATLLRELMQRRPLTPPVAPDPYTDSKLQTIAVTSGKGGVGKTTIALNLAIALARTNARVCLLDAGPGLGNIDLLCRLNGYWNLSHVISGARHLSEIVLGGPEGVNVVPGVGDLSDLADCPPTVQQEVLTQLRELELEHDAIVVDTASGTHRTDRGFLTEADVALLVTTAEPTAIADTYATLKSLSADGGCERYVIVNQVETSRQAHVILERLEQTARLFLHTDFTSAGSIPCDPCVVRSISARRPFLLDNPHCPASRAVTQLANRLKNSIEPRQAGGTFVSRIWETLRPQSEPAAACV